MAKSLTCLLIRHAATRSNLERRYIGRRSDEPLCAQGRADAESKRAIYDELERVDAVCCSPMRRAVETAEILFRDIPPERVEGLEEIDFGRFEGKTWTELSDDRDYARWIESGGTAPFPEGESREAFIERVVNAFTQAVLARPNAERIAFVVHGGCVMAILSRLTGEDYFKFQAETTCGYEVVLDIDLDSGDEADASRIRVLSYRSLDARVRA